jgi:hypothetical protein
MKPAPLRHAARQKAAPARDPVRPASAVRGAPAGDLALARALGNHGYGRWLQAEIEEQAVDAPKGETVQRAESGEGEPSDAAVRAAAAEGVRTPSGTLPYLDRIQAGFGRHSVGHVEAHVGDQATRASLAMGARAFAAGDHVVFAGEPDLRTSAHEAAHVVQQQAGVRLPGGVGREGDVYERHADAVADAVVAGRSAEGLLESFAASPLPANPKKPAAPSIQRILIRGEQPRGKYAKQLWGALRVRMIRSGLSPHGAQKHYRHLLEDCNSNFPDEESFIAFFLDQAVNEAHRPRDPDTRAWTRPLRHNRPPWPRSYKQWVTKGQDIRHIVRNATFKNAIVGEWRFRLQYGEDHAASVMREIAERMGIGGNYPTSFEWTKAIYGKAYLNLANLFFEPGAINRVIGLSADPIAHLGEWLMTSGQTAATEGEIENIFDQMGDILTRLQDQMNRAAERMERETAEVFLDGFEEFWTELDVYLADLEKGFLKSLPAVPHWAIGEELLEIAANFGFDLPGDSLPRSTTETLIQTETFLADYAPGNTEALTRILARFVSLQADLGE